MILIPTSSAISRASSAPETSLWSVIAIAPSPCSTRRLEQGPDRRGAIRRVIGVHVEVAVDHRPALQPLAGLGVARRVVAARRQPPVDGLDVVRHGAPVTRLARLPAGACEPLPQPGVPRQPLDLGGQGQPVADGKDQAELAVADDLLVELEVRDDGGRAGGQRVARYAAAPAVRRRRRARRCPLPPAPPPARSREAAAGAGARAACASTRASGSVGPSNQITASQSRSSGRCRRARRKSLSAPRSSSAQWTMRRRPCGRGVQRRLGAVRPGADQLVGAGEEALDQLAGRLAARRPGVDPPEEHLDQHPCHLGREHPLGRLVERRDVQRERMAQRS